MNEICGDNRFEIIAKAKAHLLDATNIDTSEDEMKVLDSFLFRCWQMGWLDRYDDSKDEPQYEMGMGTLKCDNCSEYGSFKCTKCDGEMYFKRLEPKDEPQTDEHCNTCRHKDECEGATYEYKNTEWWCLAYAPIEDEPQTDRSMAVGKRSDATADKYNLYGKTTTDEPQTDCDHKCIQTEIGCEKTDCAWK